MVKTQFCKRYDLIKIFKYRYGYLFRKVFKILICVHEKYLNTFTQVPYKTAYSIP